MATPNIVPRSDSEGGLGTASKYWASAYIDFVYVGAGKMGRDADNLFDFSTDNVIAFRVAGSDRVKLSDTALFPISNSGSALGGATNRWADLFLDDGAVINFDNGEVTMTHSGSGDFTIDAADDIRLDAGGGDVVLKAGGTEYGRLSNSSGDLVIKNITTDKDIIFQSDNGGGGVATYFFLDGSATQTTFQYDTRHNDSVKAKFGNENDLQIYHNATNSNIENFTGTLQIVQTVDNEDIVFRCDDGNGDHTPYITLDGENEDIDFSKPAHFLDSVNVKIGRL